MFGFGDHRKDVSGVSYGHIGYFRDGIGKRHCFANAKPDPEPYSNYCTAGVIASLVVLVDQVLKAYAFDVSKELSVFVGLIITNCIIMGRLEAFALGNGVWKSFLDGLGNAFGYGAILLAVAFFRELFGTGTLFGYQIIPEAWYASNGGYYVDNGFMLLPPMALIVVGVIIWVQRARNTKLIEEA